MCGVGDEAALRGDRQRDALQHPVDRDDERPHLNRHAFGRHRAQVVLVARIDAGGQRGHRAEQLAHEIGDEQQQDRDEDQQRQRGAPRAFASDVVAHAGFLRDRDALAVREGPDHHAIRAAAGIDRMQSVGECRRQREPRHAVVARLRWAAERLHEHARQLVAFARGCAGGGMERWRSRVVEQCRDLA